jgi:phosphoglucosamine mutase
MTASDGYYFGTDGIRDIANAGRLTAERVLRIGMAAGAVLGRSQTSTPHHRRTVIIGKDTRLSGYLLEPALTAGFVAVGMDVILVGPIPTPGVAMLTQSLRADLGVVISASHNPYHDNGIKLFGADGYKLSPSIEQCIEALINGDNSHLAVPSAQLGRVKRLDDARGRYIESIKRSFPPHLTLDGMKIVFDAANGAAYQLGPMILHELGAEVIPYATHPDGFNINHECGSTHPLTLQQQVALHKADIGIAVDGDADRLLVCDEQGQAIDGDQLLALIATRAQRQGFIRGDGIVATTMSNLGLEHYLKTRGLALIRADVGDRNVVAMMQKHGYNIGGEQSGHIIISDFATTGDGMVAALQVLAHMRETGQPASNLCHLFEPFPQILTNIPWKIGRSIHDPTVKAAIHKAEARLDGSGRILVRPSGTEQKLRIMAEGKQQEMIQQIVMELAETLR